MTKDKNITLNLEPYKSSDSTLYWGKDNGEKTRKSLSLDVEDRLDRKIVFSIPSDTTSFNPSFFLGLLSQSFKILGSLKFKSKYQIDYSQVAEDYKEVIEMDIENGLRHLINSL